MRERVAKLSLRAGKRWQISLSQMEKKNTPFVTVLPLYTFLVFNYIITVHKPSGHVFRYMNQQKRPRQQRIPESKIFVAASLICPRRLGSLDSTRHTQKIKLRVFTTWYLRTKIKGPTPRYGLKQAVVETRSAEGGAMSPRDKKSAAVTTGHLSG